jgi:hypothetical protein
MEVGAISLAMNFPSDKFEITGVFEGNDENLPVMYKTSGDEIRIAWNSLNTLNMKAGDVMLTLKVRNITKLAEDEVVQFSLAADPLNELADANAEIITKAVLVTESIGSVTNGNIDIVGKELTFGNYPNPFNHQTTFSYSLPSSGTVSIEVFDMLGSKVKSFVNEAQTAGDHTFNMTSDDLKPGVYMATLKLQTNGQLLERTIKIVRNQ